ncbi:MAG: hypothetical protein WCI17_10600 [bacterium]
MVATPYTEPLPMWVLLLHIAEPTAMRFYRGVGDLDEAQQTLGWAQFLWNTFRLPDEARRAAFAEHGPALEAFAGDIQIVLEMTMRAQSYQWDRRLVAHARIEVPPKGDWQLHIVTT